MKLLLLEDDEQLGHSIHRAIRHEGYKCDWVKSIEDAEHALHDGLYDILIFDWMLPDGSGADLLGQLRRKGISIPAMLLTSRTAPADKVTGLDIGADDYVTKPFDLDEFFARIRALTRRRKVSPSRKITSGNIILDPDSATAKLGYKRVKLSRKEFNLLRVFTERAGRYLTKRQIVDAMYEWDEVVTLNAIEVQVSRLRKKIGAGYIKTTRGFGYKFEALK